MTVEKPCPGCSRVQPAHVSRAEGEATEWQCCECGWRWSTYLSQPGEQFAFFGPDVDACVSNDVMPLAF